MAYTKESFGLGGEGRHWAQSGFRVWVPAFIAATYAVIAAVHLMKLPEWLVLVGGIPYLIATFATFDELRANGRSGWWIILMIAHFGLGPTVLGIPVVGALINLVPVILASKRSRVPSTDQG